MSAASRYAVDFHVHTAYSFDSVTPPKVVIEMARRRGLDGIAVTDHNTIAGAVATAEANRYSDFLVIAGIEAQTDRGDVIGLYVQRDIESRKFSEVIDEIREQGGLVYLPHPIRTFGVQGTKDVCTPESGIDLWERYNGRYSARDFANADAVFDEMRLGDALCGSDAHFPWEVGLLRTVLDSLPRDPQTLRDALPGASLEARPRSDFARRSGTTLGEAVKTYKRGEFSKAGLLLASLPWKAFRRRWLQRIEDVR
jgi:predicted metal-dependent phosphoesterase TrpH